jgi:hypothetical protein
MATELSFNAVTTNADGSALTLPVTYTALIDTVNPPVKAYPIQANIAPVAGLIIVTFAELGFVPAANQKYFVEVTATDSAGTSGPSNEATFTNTVVLSEPTGLKVG